MSAVNPMLSHDQPQDHQQTDVESEFPVNRLAKLDEQLSRPKWVVPVRPGDDLELLLRSAIKLCKEGAYYVFLLLLQLVIVEFLSGSSEL